MKLTLKLFLSCIVLSMCVHGTGASRATNQDPVQDGQELLNLSYEQNKSDHPLALKTAREALTLFQSANDSAGIARAYFQIARCHHAQSDLVEATANYQLALQQWRELNNVKQQATTLIMLAYVEQRKGEWLNAMSYYGQAQTVETQPDSYQLGQIASGMADLFNENGLPEDALVQLQSALNYYRQANDARAINRAIMEIGFTQFLQKDYSASLISLQEALAASTPYSLEAAECHENMGRVHIALGEYSTALAHLQPALLIYESATNPTEAARVRAWIAQAYEQQGLLARARPQYLAALDVFRRLEDRISEATVYFALGRLELKAGNLDNAEAYLRRSIENTEDIRNSFSSRDLTTAYSASVHERYEAYITCLLRKAKTRPSEGLTERAFEASELSRARSLAELLRDTQTNLLAGVDPRLAEREKTLRQSIRAKIEYRITLLADKIDKKKLIELETSLKQLREEHQQVFEELRRLNPAYGQLTQPTAYSLQQIQSEIVADGQTALVEYILGDDASYAWVVTRDNIKLTELPKEAAITDAVRKVYALLSVKPDGDSDDRLNQATNELSKLVIDPIANQLTAPRIIVVADGALNYIPFQLLPASADREPLVAGHEIVNAPSASILGQLRQERLKRPAAPKLLAAFGYPAFPSNYAELKGSNTNELLATVRIDKTEQWNYAVRDIEVSGDTLNPSTIQPLLNTKEELANLQEVAGADSFVATGFTASRETLEHTDLSQYAILHLATHGILNPNRPELSGFLLSLVGSDGHQLNGFMTVQDVYGLRAPVSLVVLSACRTGLGKDVRGEGLIGLTRGFMYAGASSVAASLWNVNDEATAELMKYFYANMLQEGMTPAAALRAAQNTIRKQPHWRSPHYWAAFTLQGEYKEPIKEPTKLNASSIRKIVVGGLLLGLLACVAWWYWRRLRVTTAY